MAISHCDKSNYEKRRSAKIDRIFLSYIKLHPDANPEALAQKINDLAAEEEKLADSDNEGGSDGSDEENEEPVVVKNQKKKRVAPTKQKKKKKATATKKSTSSQKQQKYGSNVQKLLDLLGKEAPKLIEDLVPKILSLSVIVKVIQNLLYERGDKNFKT